MPCCPLALLLAPTLLQRAGSWGDHRAANDGSARRLFPHKAARTAHNQPGGTPTPPGASPTASPTAPGASPQPPPGGIPNPARGLPQGVSDSSRGLPSPGSPQGLAPAPPVGGAAATCPFCFLTPCKGEGEKKRLDGFEKIKAQSKQGTMGTAPGNSFIFFPTSPSS